MIFSIIFYLYLNETISKLTSNIRVKLPEKYVLLIIYTRTWLNDMYIVHEFHNNSLCPTSSIFLKYMENKYNFLYILLLKILLLVFSPKFRASYNLLL